MRPINSSDVCSTEASRDVSDPTDEKLRCVSCRDVIGAYEPLIAILDGRARSTSKTAEPNRAEPLGDCYHRACFTRRYGEPDE